ncbi:MAG: glucosamine-6-phosphate deaminase [Tannerellaceae bacterium]|jgi:glucosamine-6-phosphate deaminase|nr:glucosamine-6-phosphate deaminase [Tannerellaceae bacterium]
MNITIVNSEAEFDHLAAQRILAGMQSSRPAVIGLSTGRTTANMHRLAVELYLRHPFDISGVSIVGLDEVTNVSRDYSGACYAMLKSQFVDALGLGDRFFMPPTMSDDFDIACMDYEAAIEALGGIDLQILGLGKNGHIGFNQPGTPFESRVWHSRMDDELEARIRLETGASADRPLGGLTLGIRNIMHSRKILLVAKGAEKAEAVRMMLHGPVTPSMPASVLQLHPFCEFLFDVEAAKFIL